MEQIGFFNEPEEYVDLQFINPLTGNEASTMNLAHHYCAILYVAAGCPREEEEEYRALVSIPLLRKILPKDRWGALPGDLGHLENDHRILKRVRSIAGSGKNAVYKILPAVLHKRKGAQRDRPNFAIVQREPTVVKPKSIKLPLLGGSQKIPAVSELITDLPSRMDIDYVNSRYPFNDMTGSKIDPQNYLFAFPVTETKRVMSAYKTWLRYCGNRYPKFFEAQEVNLVRIRILTKHRYGKQYGICYREGNF